MIYNLLPKSFSQILDTLQLLKHIVSRFNILLPKSTVLIGVLVSYADKGTHSLASRHTAQFFFSGFTEHFIWGKVTVKRYPIALGLNGW